MKIKAIHTIMHDGQRYKPGSVFDIDEVSGKVLVAQRFAVSAEETAAPIAAPKKPTKQQAAEA